MLILAAFLVILLLEAARRQRKEALVVEYQYRLFALRDQIREQAMEDPRLAQKWVFQYFDSTIARSIRLLPELSIWHLLALMIAHRNDASLERSWKALNEEMAKKGNERYKQVEEKLSDTLAQFIVSRHILMLLVSAALIILPVAIGRTLRELKRKSLQLVLESPETSTLPRFAPSY